jgi:hypothetical protein
MMAESRMQSTALTGNAQQANTAQIAELLRHERELQLLSSDIEVQISQLREQQALTDPTARARFNEPLAEAQHRYTATRLDYDATHAKRIALEKESQVGSATVQQPTNAHPGRRLLDNPAFGAFVLMIPIVFALSRRIWVRSGPKAQPAYDLESSPRLQRLEDAVESIAIEIERIGEAQRFATKLLAERRPDVANVRVNSTPSASGDRTPGTITPH